MKKKYIFTQNDCEKMIQMHSDGKLNKEIAKCFNTSISTINRQLAQLGVPSRHPSVTKEREQAVIDLYKKYHQFGKIAKEIKMNEKTIKDILIKHNIPLLTMSEIRTYRTINEHYFDVIDTHRKAYYLGLLYADGSVSEKTSCVQIALQEIDKHILEQFRIDLETDYALSFLNYHDKNPNWQNQYCLSITNWQIHNALIAHGVVPNKSLIAEFPQDLSSDLYSSFILGVLDGDGTIHKKECRVCIVGTKMMCTAMKNIIKDTLDIHCTIILCHGNTDVVTRVLSIAGRNQVKKFLDWLYSKSDIYLYRKYEIYQNVYCSK